MAGMNIKIAPATSSLKIGTKPESMPGMMGGKMMPNMMGMDMDMDMAPNLMDTMTRIPKMAGPMEVAEAHSANTKMLTQRFGTKTERDKMNSDVNSNYPGCGDDCPTY